jgi:ABC-type Mn2+/Zn2+ transport system permease subunit
MIAAALVIPAVVARLLTARFGTLLWLSMAIGSACGLVGMYASYYLDVSSGATIVLVAAGLFIVTLAVSWLGARGRRAPTLARIQGLAASPD